MMDLNTLKRVVRGLKRSGFDDTHSSQRITKGQVVRTIYVRCSQCAVLVINEVACHETGCPNERTARRRTGR